MPVELPAAAPDRWDAGRAALQRYLDTRGAAAPPRAAHVGSFPLGRWVAQVREDYWEATLDPDRITELEAVPGWSWGPAPAKSWRACYSAWQQCSTETEACDTYLEQCAPPLERWARLQREAFAAGALHPYRIALLEQLNVWVWDPLEHRWHRGLAVLRHHLAAHGTAEVPRSYRTDDGFPLGQWVNRCREDFRAGALPADRIAALEALPGWRWGGADGTWRIGLASLHRFVDTHGHAAPSQHHVDGDLRLGLWVAQRRNDYRAR